MKTTGRARVAGPGFASFAERKAKGFGEFMDSTFLRENEHRRLPDILQGLRGLDIVTPSTCRLTHRWLCDWRVAVTRKTAQTTCTLQVVLDGTVVQKGIQIDDRYAPPLSPPEVVRAYEEKLLDAWQQTFDLNQVSIANLIGVEVYRTGSEAQDVYGGAGTNCGVVVLWTHR